MKKTLLATLLACSLQNSRAGDDFACEAPATWFPHTTTPAPDFHNPDANSEGECGFYRWAWQTFLYLTQPVEGGQPRFLTFKTPAELFVSKSKTPAETLDLAKKGQLSSLERFTTPIRSMEISRGHTLRLAPRLEKQKGANIGGNSILQADALGALVDQNGHAVYYGMHVNERFVQFCVDEKFTDASNLAIVGDDKPFPTGSIELKSSWKIVEKGESEDGFYVTDATLPSLVAGEGGAVTVDASKPISARVALVGLHVVGVVEGHPEFVWATFEHRKNAPYLNGAPMGDDGPKAANGDFVVSPFDKTFYKAQSKAKECNVPNAKTNIPANRLRFDGDPAGQKLLPHTQVFRQFQFGGEQDPAEIRDLNDSVHAQLNQSSVWKSYGLVGALWLEHPGTDFKSGQDFDATAEQLVDAGHPPFSKEFEDGMDAFFGGEYRLSNSTMETFTQPQKHCFSCHSTEKEKNAPAGFLPFPARKVGVSHILREAYKDNPRPVGP